MNTCNPLPLPTEPFNVAVLQDKMTNGQLRDHLDAINYIAEYYFENANGGTYHRYNPKSNDFEFKEKKDFTNEVLNKVGNDAKVVEYFKTNSKIYNIVSEIYMPRHYNIGNCYYINLCQGLLHKNVKPYAEYSDKVKAKVNIIIKMILEISCSNDPELFQAVIKWYSQVVRGIRTEVILYKKSPEGTGKSTETDFIMKYVIGEKVCISPTTECLTSNFNKCLMGQVLVIFEELPCFSSGQWAGVSTKLKGYATNPQLQFRDLYEKSITATNVFNAIINTNVEAIKNSEQRRIVILPINTSQMKNLDYFENVRNNCFNMECGEAFYAYLLSIDVSNFKAQHDFPLTEQKKNAISQMLPSPFKFLKQKILENREIGRIKQKELYDEYIRFCQSNNMKFVLFNQFVEKMTEIQIISKKTSRVNKTTGKTECGTMFYDISLEHLKSIADKSNWISDYDEYDEENDNNDTVSVSRQEYEEFKIWKARQQQEDIQAMEKEVIIVKPKIKKTVVKPVIEAVVEPVVDVKPKIKKVIKKTKNPTNTDDVPSNLIDELFM